jgi:hypothetical protein
MTVVDDFLNTMTQLGFFEFLLPWLFVFAIVYGLLIKLNIFGEANQKISAILAMVLAFFTAPFAGVQLAAFFVSLGTEVTIVLAGLLTIMLFAGILGIEKGIGEIKHIKYAVVALAAIVFFIALGGEITNFTLGSNTVMTVVFLAVLVGAIWYVIGGGGSAPAAEKSE